MATTISNQLRIRNAKNLVQTLSGGAYVFVGKPTEWSTGDETPPTPVNNIQEYITLFNEMLSLKRITGATDLYHGIVKNQWASGSVYDMYRHDITSDNPATSGAINLLNASFVVINQTNNVYACLFNNGGAQSTVEPLSVTDEPFYTSDGYQWIRLYNLTSSNLDDNSTQSFIPIATGIDNDPVITTDGAIYTVVVDSAGDNITTSPVGASNQIPYYFCNILGDGTGAVARVAVTTGSVTSIEVVRNGQDYTYGFLNFKANEVYQSLNDLDAGINSLDPEGDGTFQSTVIINPPGGWGTDLIEELGGTRILVFSSLSGTEPDFDSGVTYRQIGLLTAPDNAGTAQTLAATKAIKAETAGTNSFTINEVITQSVEDENEYVHTAKGIVVGWDSTNGIVKYIQDPEIHSDTDGVLYSFSGSSAVVGSTSAKSITPDTDFTADSGDRSFVSGYSAPEFSLYSGEVLYLSNQSPVLRTETQTEKITLVVQY